MFVCVRLESLLSWILIHFTVRHQLEPERRQPLYLMLKKVANPLVPHYNMDINQQREEVFMKKFLQEFKAFALRGNVLDLAVGVLIGGAFSGLVTSLTQNIISPIIGLFGGANFDAYILNINGATIQYGAFITAVINFLIMAFIVFLIVKGIHKLESLGRRKETPAAPTTKTCPYCRSQIDIQATRCPHCTSELADDPS